ncbi:MAG: riboflavin synthase [Thermodesulfobacteriota bacterium]|nr:MAG: riboflavin synthase [Thermodesulfobacteriota bacterium]
MFTGLVEGIGRITKLIPEKGGVIVEINTSFPLENTQIGDSISVDGVCLTIIELKKYYFRAQISPETLIRTTFKYKKINDLVNLERALRLGDRLGGHFVSGHVDGIGKILSITRFQDFSRFEIEIPRELSPYIIKKGSIAIDGVSLTINEIVKENIIQIMLIPHTLRVTTLSRKNIGDWVNIEVDMIAKMVHKWLSPYLSSLKSTQKEKITIDLLEKYGFL